MSSPLLGNEGEITTEFFLNLGLGKFRIIVSETCQANPASIVEKLGSGEEEIPVRHSIGLLDLPCMAFRGLLADLLIGGFHGRMVMGRRGNGKGAFGGFRSAEFSIPGRGSGGNASRCL